MLHECCVLAVKCWQCRGWWRELCEQVPSDNGELEHGWWVCYHRSQWFLTQSLELSHGQARSCTAGWLP